MWFGFGLRIYQNNKALKLVIGLLMPFVCLRIYQNNKALKHSCEYYYYCAGLRIYQNNKALKPLPVCKVFERV